MDKQRSRGRRALAPWSVQGYSSPDVPNLWTWRPSNYGEVYFLLEFEVGNATSADVFSVIVATPEALRARASDQTFILAGRATIIVFDYDWDRIKKGIESIVRDCTKDLADWHAAAAALQRHFRWEYE